MIKATILHTEASNGWGGQEIRIHREMMGMRERGYRVLLASSPETEIFRRSSASGIIAIPVSMERRRLVHSVLSVRRLLRNNGVDLINTHSSSDSWIGSIAGCLAGVPVLRTRHISSRVNGDVFTRLLYGRLCDEVITTGEFIRHQLIRDLKLDPGRVRSIPTGISLKDFEGSDGRAFRSAFDIPGSAPVVGIAAVLRSWKGHLVLLDAMSLVRQAIPDVKLLIVGEGPMRRVIEARIGERELQDHVIMTGYQDRIAQAIGAFDIAVMASYASEGIPQFALQSMASGKPVVATRVGGIPEVVRHGETGLLVEPKDPEALADAVVSLLRDENLRHRLGEQGRRLVESHHSLERMLDQVEDCYRRLL